MRISILFTSAVVIAVVRFTRWARLVRNTKPRDAEKSRETAQGGKGLASRVDLVLILNLPGSTGNVALGKLLPSLHIALLVCI